MRHVTFGDHFIEMTILSLYDLICRRPMVRKITRSTQLLTRHGLHEAPFQISLVRIVPRHRVPGGGDVPWGRSASKSVSTIVTHHLDVGRTLECDSVAVDIFTACRPAT